ncbi:MAG TPA: ABC transporter substrate-binding protein [Clostridia bacterium]|nr:ABC transporter substrate-binding protein [Clostridia bacterium]
MKRFKVWLVLLLVVALVPGCGLATGAGPDRPIHRVGVLVGTDFRLAKVEGLLDGLPVYGYVPGENVELVIKNAQGDNSQLGRLAQELADAGVEVIATAGRVETEAAKEAVQAAGIPIVFMGLTGLREEGLVQDLLHPKEGLTGVHNDHAALSGKRLELLVKLLPGIKKVLVLYDPQVVPTREALRATRAAAEKTGTGIVEAPVTTPQDIEAVLDRVEGEVQGILLLPSVFLESTGARALAPLALKLGLPVMGVEYSEEVQGLFAIYGITPYDQGYQAARILAKVLSGHRAGDIPVEPPSVLKLTVNLEVAAQLGLSPDPLLLGFADLICGEGGDSLDP